ncbi:MAG: hypothetical protein LBD30_06405 [Verrucomicrobiales bacterium]|jgi:hypothetical protein|nr:hypothetical protein [Verrucomicrobiales bacterium]
MIEVLWLVIGFVLAVGLCLVYQGYRWAYERFMLSPEERWRRNYDRKLKKHFKSL